MVSPAAIDALADPTAALVNLFDGELDDFPQKVSKHFSTLFLSSNFYDEVPFLNLAHPPHVYKNRSLVRFRAMVQDTSISQEMYLAKLSHGGCGGWGIEDVGDASATELDYTNLRECQVIWAVSIPGESPWCLDELHSASLPPVSPSSNSPNHSTPLSHKFPLPSTSHVGAQVKIYNSPSEPYKSTDLIEFTGILTSEPYAADIEQLVPTFVPTLHVLFSRPLPVTIIPQRSLAIAESDVEGLRQDLIDWLANETLAGDKVAAEWILLCAIARVQSRHPPIHPPAITLSHFPSPHSSPSVPAISHALSLIFPLLATIPLSLHTLNERYFFPLSDGEDFHSGWLQLPRATLCVIVESGISEGEINGKALSNIRAVQDVLDSQSLQYIFPYSSFSFDTDLNFILLAEGRKSTFFQTHFNVPFQPATDIPLDELKTRLYKPLDSLSIPPHEKLTEFRQLVCSAKIGNLNLEQSAARHIQEDYVEERKSTDSKNINRIDSNDLMHRITLARLYALSLRHSNVNVAVWEKVKIMEAERKARLAR